MAKNRNRKRQQQRSAQQPVNQAVEDVEAAEQKPINVKMSLVGNEPIILLGITNEQFNVLNEWYRGLRADVIDIPMGDTVLFINRRLATNMVASTNDLNEKGDK